MSRGIQPHVFAVEESNGISASQLREMRFGSDAESLSECSRLLKEFHNAKTYGSLVDVTPSNWSSLKETAYPIEDRGQLRLDIEGIEDASERIRKIIDVGQALSQKYHVVVTNPPYLSSGNMSGELSDFLKNRYPQTKSDLCTCFIEKSFEWLVKEGFSSMITMESWMSLSSFKDLRSTILNQKTITDRVHMPYLGKGGTSL